MDATGGGIPGPSAVTDAYSATVRVADALGAAGIPIWIGEREFPALSPEDLVVLKAMFNRAKDCVDIERIVAALGSRFDAAYARRKLVEHVGERDAGVSQLDRLVLVWCVG